MSIQPASQGQRPEYIAPPVPPQVYPLTGLMRETLPLTGPLVELPESAATEHLLPIKTLIERNGSRSVVIEFSPSRRISTIITHNPFLEETYIALIIKMVIELIVALHEVKIFNIDCSSGNLILRSSGQIALRDWTQLTHDEAHSTFDTANFVRFVQSLTQINKQNEKEACISKNFKEFLHRALVESKTATGDEYFRVLLSTKFLHRKANILTDLLDDAQSISLSVPFQSESCNPSSSNKLNSQEVIEGSGNSTGFKTEEGEETRHRAELASARVTRVIDEVFNKYVNALSKKQEAKIANILASVQTTLIEMEGKSPGSAIRLIKKYLKIKNF